MRKFLSVVFLLLLPLTLFSQDFRVGGPWQPIPFAGSNFILTVAGTWGQTAAPSTFQYKNLGDTVFINIAQGNGGGCIDTASPALQILLPSALPQISGVVTGSAVLRLLLPGDVSVNVPSWFYATANWIGIQPNSGAIANDLIPAGACVGPNLSFFYRAETN